MAFVPYPPVNISQAISVFKQDVELAHGIVHGDENTEVLTENGLVPSFKNVIEYLKDEVAAATGVDVSLRSDLAAVNSSVLIGGVPADNVGRLFRSVMYVEAPAGDAGVFLNTLVSLGVEYIVCSGGNFVFETSLVVTSTKLKIHGAGSTKTLFKRGSSLGTANIITGSLHDLEVHHIGFDTGKGTYTPSLADFTLENAINSLSPSKLSIRYCAFNNLVNLGIVVNGTALNEAKNIDISDNTVSNGSRGFSMVRRYGNNVRMDRNVLYNSVDVTNTLFKPLEISGTNDGWMCDNIIIQDNGAGGQIIFEYIDRPCINVHMQRNSYYGGGDGAYKVGGSTNVWFEENHSSGGVGVCAYFEGVENLWIGKNRLRDAGRNNLVLAQDAQTHLFCKNVKVYDNQFDNANMDNETAGTPYGALGSVNSYHAWVQEGTENIEFRDNHYIKGTYKAGGLLISSPSYLIDGDNFNKLDATAVTIHNGFAPSGAVYKIVNCIGCGTIDKGRLTISGTSGLIEPRIVNHFNAHTLITLRSPLNGTLAYIYAEEDAPPNMAVICKDSSHTSVAPLTPINVDWMMDCSTSAKGALGKTD